MSDEPNLTLVWEALTGYQRTAALKAGIELDLFTLISGGATTIEALAQKTGAAPRGLRALLNHLTVDGFLKREGENYGLTVTAAMFLDRSSQAFLGSAVTFIASPMLREAYESLTQAVVRGGTAVPQEGTLAAEHPVWVEFARAMAPMANMTAMLLGGMLDIGAAPGGRVLDIAAGHGMFGIALAQLNPKLEVTALDWKNVLAVADENARKGGVSDRFRKIEGSAFDVDWGSGYDFVLLPNFLHHFDPSGCEQILAKARAALAPQGKLVILEFIPDEDRSKPADAVRFSLVMLASTPAGDAYTFSEFQRMLKHAGFSQSELRELIPSPARVILASV